MTTAEIHRQLCDVYGEHTMISSMERRWVRLFNEGRENVHDDSRSGRPSVVNEDLVRAVEAKIRGNRWFTNTPLSLHLPQISRSLRHKIVSEVKEAVTTCFASQAASFYDEGIQKLVQRYDKSLNNSRKCLKVVYSVYIKWQYTWILCLLDLVSLWQLKNKRPTLCHLLLYFISYVLNMFRTLIYPIVLQPATRIPLQTNHTETPTHIEPRYVKSQIHNNIVW